LRRFWCRSGFLFWFCFRLGRRTLFRRSRFGGLVTCFSLRFFSGRAVHPSINPYLAHFCFWLEIPFSFHHRQVGELAHCDRSHLTIHSTQLRRHGRQGRKRVGFREPTVERQP